VHPWQVLMFRLRFYGHASRRENCFPNVSCVVIKLHVISCIQFPPGLVKNVYYSFIYSFIFIIYLRIERRITQWIDNVYLITKTKQVCVVSPDILSRHLSAQLSKPSYPVPAPVFEPVTFRLQGSRAAHSTAKYHVTIRVDR
jgi:hypothetical protein